MTGKQCKPVFFLPLSGQSRPAARGRDLSMSAGSAHTRRQSTNTGRW
jgi:hypothetical protein